MATENLVLIFMHDEENKESKKSWFDILKSFQIPDIQSQNIMALATGVILQGLLDPQAADWQEVGQHGLHVILEGIRKK